MTTDPHDFETHIRRLKVEPPSASFEDSNALMDYLHGAEKDLRDALADMRRQAKQDALALREAVKQITEARAEVERLKELNRALEAVERERGDG
jgi:hypothetical protein